MIAAHFKIMRTLSARLEPGWIVRLRSSVLRVERSEGYLFNVRRCEEPPVVCVEDIGLIMLVGHANPRADLTLIVEPLDRVAAHSDIERPVIGRAPLILHPEFLPGLNVLI